MLLAGQRFGKPLGPTPSSILFSTKDTLMSLSLDLILMVGSSSGNHKSNILTISFHTVQNFYFWSQIGLYSSKI